MLGSTKLVRVALAIGVSLAVCANAAAQQSRAPAAARGGAASGASGLSTSERAALKGDALIQYDVDTNTLIVITDEETNEQIKKVVEALDSPVPEVLIKVLFLEVTHTSGLNMGADIKKTNTHINGSTGQVDTQIIESIFNAASITNGGIYSIVEKDLNATIAALSEVTKLEVLSRPSILAKNNKEATITIGQSIPLVANSRVTDTGQTINTLAYQDIGIILEVTPHIMENNTLSLDVAPQISQLTGETVAVTDKASEPVISLRSASTSVVVPDGSTVIIGGLMEDNKTKNAKKVPLLGDIPLLGNLFKRRTDQKTKTELLIFLTPHVVRGAEELATMTTKEQDRYEIAPKAFPEKDMKRYLEPIVPLEAPPQEVEAAPATPEAPPADEAPKPPKKSGANKNKGVFYSVN